MQKIVIIVSIASLFGNFMFAQNFEYKFKTSNFERLYLDDSLEYEMDYNDVYSFNFKKFYSSSYNFILKNGREIKVHYYSDTTIYFEEMDKKGGVIMSSGELVIDSSKFSIAVSDDPMVDSIGDPLLDELGNLIYSADTSFYVVPNGLWCFRISANTYALVNYKMGKKNGNSHIEISSGCIQESIYLSKSNFENGNMVDSFRFELPSWNKLNELVKGTWYHPYCSEYLFNDHPIWIFQRKVPNSKPRDSMYSSTFNDKGVYDGVIYYTCGTGRTKSDYFPKYHWEIPENSTLSIENVIYEILFISDEYMILVNI